MNKIQNTTKKAGAIKQGRIVLWAILFTLIILQGISAWALTSLWNDGAQRSKQSLYGYINSVEEKRYKYPVIGIAESRVYIPEVRAYLPLNETTRDLRYYYSNTPGKNSLALSTSSQVGAQNESDDPTCDRIVLLEVSKKPSNPTYYDAGEIQPTKDGLRYLHAHNKNTCSIYRGTVQEDLIRAIKSINQY